MSERHLEILRGCLMPARGGTGCRYCPPSVSSPERLTHEEFGQLPHEDRCPVAMSALVEASEARASAALAALGDLLDYGLHVPCACGPDEWCVDCWRLAAYDRARAILAAQAAPQGEGA